MLCIVASYHCMQFQGTLMNQTWENGKKTSFETDFGPLDPNLGHHFFFFFFFSKIWLCQSLDIMVSYHHLQYQKKLMTQPWENLVMNRRTEESHFIGHCPTKIKRPKWNNYKCQYQFTKYRTCKMDYSWNCIRCTCENSWNLKSIVDAWVIV